jgi:hypothetical protein
VKAGYSGPHLNTRNTQAWEKRKRKGWREDIKRRKKELRGGKKEGEGDGKVRHVQVCRVRYNQRSPVHPSPRPQWDPHPHHHTPMGGGGRERFTRVCLCLHCVTVKIVCRQCMRAMYRGKTFGGKRVFVYSVHIIQCDSVYTTQSILKKYDGSLMRSDVLV